MKKSSCLPGANSEAVLGDLGWPSTVMSGGADDHELHT